MALVKLYVVGAARYGSPLLRQTYLKGQSFEVDEGVAAKLCGTTYKDKANNVHPVLVRSGDPLAAKYEKVDAEANGASASAVKKKRVTRKKKAST